VVEDGPAQVVDQALTDAGGQPPGDDAEPRLGDRDDRDQHRQPHDDAHLALLDDGVDHPAGQHGRRHRQDRSDDAEQEEDRELPAVRSGEAGDPPQCRSRERAPLLLRVHRVVQRHPSGDFHVHCALPGAYPTTPASQPPDPMNAARILTVWTRCACLIGWLPVRNSNKNRPPGDQGVPLSRKEPLNHV
jgi:hypothetical protein